MRSLLLNKWYSLLSKVTWDMADSLFQSWSESDEEKERSVERWERFVVVNMSERLRGTRGARQY